MISLGKAAILQRVDQTSKSRAPQKAKSKLEQEFQRNAYREAFSISWIS